MELRPVIRWVSDDKKETTEAVVVVSCDGLIVKRLSYVKWNIKNNNYSIMNEHKYKISENRGKQRLETEKRSKYQNVCIRDKWYSVHRLVALAWVPNPENKPQVNHIDGDRSNNHYQNLGWVTNTENIRHSIDTGLRDFTKQQVCTDEQVKQMKHLRLNGVNTVKIGEKYGISYETVRTRTNKIMTEQEIRFAKSLSLGGRK